jgi:signal transduction histidine kinase
VEAGELSVSLERVDLADYLGEVVADLEAISEDHPVHLHDRTRGGGATIVALDRVRVRQILTNLIDNAAKFSPPGSPIDITYDDGGGGTISVTVADRGPGVPAERRGELFQRFSRLDSMAKGTGLGLYISRGLARAHGGDLTYEDRDDLAGGTGQGAGAGARFRLTHPGRRS